MNKLFIVDTHDGFTSSGHDSLLDKLDKHCTVDYEHNFEYDELNEMLSNCQNCKGCESLEQLQIFVYLKMHWRDIGYRYRNQKMDSARCTNKKEAWIRIQNYIDNHDYDILHEFYENAYELFHVPGWHSAMIIDIIENNKLECKLLFEE